MIFLFDLKFEVTLLIAINKSVFKNKKFTCHFFKQYLLLFYKFKT